jgi:hypothetical protein
MKRTQFIVGCVLIAAGIAWPSMTIVHGLKHFAEVYRTAAQQHRNVGVAQRSTVVAAVENGVSSIIGGVVVSLLGITLALGRPAPAELMDAGVET